MNPKLFINQVLNAVGALGFFAAPAFFFAYMAGTVLFFPTAAMNLAAGILFGVWKGFALALGASLTAASAGFLAGRYLSRGWVKKRVESNKKIRALDDAVAQRGWKLVLLLRLAGILPFTLLNYGLGLSKIRFRDYFLASLGGMIPGTLLYAYLGAAAGRAMLEDRPHKNPVEYAMMAACFAATMGMGLYSASIVKKAMRTA